MLGDSGVGCVAPKLLLPRCDVTGKEREQSWSSRLTLFKDLGVTVAFRVWGFGGWRPQGFE